MQELYLFTSIMFFWVSANTLTMSWGIRASGMLVPSEVFPAISARHTCGMAACHSRREEEGCRIAKRSCEKGLCTCRADGASRLPLGSVR